MLDKDILLFVDWAAGHWEALHNLFMVEDRNQYVVKGAIGRKGLSPADWAHKLRELGFQGNARVVFEEIAGECRNEKEERRRAHTPMAAANRSARSSVFSETISLSQLNRFQTRVAAISARWAADRGSSAVSRFAKLLLHQRGSLLRAWRLDVDLRGAGRVAYLDFVHACRRLGVANQARPIWASLRHKEDSRPLEFAELASEEGSNLEAFAETLWNSMGFDLEKAWSFMDVNGQHWLSMEEFESGARKLGFEGNTRLLFRGLDTSGLGRVWHNEFDYLRLVTRVGPRKLQQTCGPVSDLIQWVQRRLGGVDELIALLGLTSANREIGIGDLVVRLAALGFEGDALQAASKAARHDGGTKISAETLSALFSTAPMPSNSLNETMRSRGTPSRKRQGLGTGTIKQVWNDGVDDMTALNRTKPKGKRHYFSVPERVQDFCPPPRKANPHSASSPSLQGRPTQKPCWNPGYGSPAKKPAWNDNVQIFSDINSDLPSCRRKYFSDTSDKPVREAMRTKLQRSQSARALREVSPKASSPSPVELFARFAVSRFGSPEKAFRKLDVDGSGLLKHRDFNLQVQRAGFAENPNPVFQQLDRHRRGAVSLEEFVACLQQAAAVSAGYGAKASPQTF